MRMLLSILFLLSASLFRVAGQVREITGTVKCATGSLPGALVTVTTEADDHVLAYAVADAEGHFALKVAEAAQGSRFIHARMMGYTAQKVLLTPDRSEYAFVLAEASVMLKEVKVRATPISGAGDTTRYLASSFARENDITLADVIKRMPGFHISADGRIKYAGREISNFYIDGSDMMTGNYTTAIRSIKHDDVGRVEVIEHHQPIKLFEDLLFSDQTAVNVTLKERAKNRWVGVVEAGGGVPRLWQVDASAMRFAQKVKTMNTYKGNNTGRDVVGGGTSGGGSAREVIALPSADNPYLERSRTLFNRSHRLSLNNQWDMGRSFTLTPCMELFGAETESDAAETRRYYLDDGQTRELTTRQSGRRRLHGASPSVRLEANTRRMYLSNVLTSDIRRSSGRTDAVGTYSNVADGQVDGAYLRNDLYVLFRRGRRVVGIKSAIEWSRLPQRLDIRRAEAEMGERIGASAFRAQTSTSQMIGFGRATLSLEEGFSYDQSAFQSDLRGVILADSARNDFCYRTASLRVTPSLNIGLTAWKFGLSIPADFRHSDYIDRLADRSYIDRRLHLSPTASVVRIFGRHVTTSLSGSWQSQPEDPSTFFSAPLVASYPYLQTGTTAYSRAEMTTVSATIRYKNILHGLFGNLICTRMWQHSRLMPTQDFGEIYITSGFVHRPHLNLSDYVAASLSYMIPAIRGGVTLNGSFSSSQSQLMQSGHLRRLTSSMRQLALHVYASPRSWLDLDYTADLSDYIYRPDHADRQTTRTLHQQLSVTLTPLSALSFTASGSHDYHTLAGSGKHIYLLDARVAWRLSRLFTFRLTAQNLLDYRTFAYTSYTDLMATEQTYRLRPFTLLLTVLTTF